MASTSNVHVEEFDKIKDVLNNIRLNSLLQNFVDSKIDTLSICRGLNDQELTRLGITTIGDRVRFRDEVNKSK